MNETRRVPLSETLADAGALVQVRAFIARSDLRPHDRLPPERELCALLGVTRGDLRKALMALEIEGVVTRHVGRGTFLAPGAAGSEGDLAGVAKQASPRAVMRARYLIEPVVAEEAAQMASQDQIDAIARTAGEARRVESWREYETLDNQFHRLVAEASGNVALLAMFDQLNALRRTVVWGRLRPERTVPAPDHHSFAEHDAIVAALAERDGAQAHAAMRAHLTSVARGLFPDAL